MKIKGVDEETLKRIAFDMEFVLRNVRKQGNFTQFTLGMLYTTKRVPDQRWRKRGFSGRWTGAVCFHGHWEFFRRVFDANPNALIVTKFRRWTSLADLEANALDVGETNAGSAFNPQSYDSQCDC